jgi:hypothetical protein
MESITSALARVRAPKASITIDKEDEIFAFCLDRPQSANCRKTPPTRRQCLAPHGTAFTSERSPAQELGDAPAPSQPPASQMP